MMSFSKSVIILFIAQRPWSTSSTCGAVSIVVYNNDKNNNNNICNAVMDCCSCKRQYNDDIRHTTICCGYILLGVTSLPLKASSVGEVVSRSDACSLTFTGGLGSIPGADKLDSGYHLSGVGTMSSN